MRSHSYIGMLAIMLSSPLAHHVQAASPKPPRSHAITIDDFFDIGQMQNVAISPDGKHAVWLESRWDKALDKAQSDLWLINTQDKQTQRLTFSHENESSPSWSHDSRFIYFLSSQQNQEVKKSMKENEVLLLSNGFGTSNKYNIHHMNNKPNQESQYDNVFTLNTETNKLEVQPVLNTTAKHYNDDMIHIYGSNIDMMITKKHKVVLWDRNDNPYILTGEELPVFARFA